MAEQFDIVTVCFSGDAQLLKLQARSFDKFLSPEAIGKIFVLANDPNSVEFANLFCNEILPEYGSLRDRVVFLDRRALLSEDYTATGWRVQQALKLLVSEKVGSDVYMALDAKNHFLRAVDYGTFVDQGKLQSTYFTPKSSMRNYFDHSLRYFGLDPEEAVRNAMPATTPYLLRTDLVRYLIRYVEARERCAFADFFLRKTRHVTEFFMYFGFLKRFGIEPEALYHFGRPRTVSLFTSYPSDPKTVVRALEQLKNPRTIMLGLHRNRIAQLTEQQKTIVCDAWLEAKLIASVDEGLGFLGQT